MSGLLFAGIPPVLAWTIFWDDPITEWGDGRGFVAVSFWAPWIRWVPFVFALSVVLLSMLRRGGLMPAPKLAGFALLAVVIFWFSGAVGRGLHWHVSAERVGPDSRRYAVLRASSMGDFDELLCRTPPSSDSLVRTHYEVLAAFCNRGIPGRRSTSLIQPASYEHWRMPPGAEDLVASNYGARCRWVHGAIDDDGQVLPRLSPFLLLDETTRGRDDDLAAITARLAHPYWEDDSPKTRFLCAHPEAPGADKLFFEVTVEIPAETSLLDDFDSPNAWIRAAAKRIVEAGGADMYPEATKRIASGPK